MLASLAGWTPAADETCRASLLNLLGLGLPMVAALVWIPGLLAALGPSRFGVLALIWTVANYFGLLTWA